MKNFSKFFGAAVILIALLTIWPAFSMGADNVNDVVRFSWTIFHKPAIGEVENINLKKIPTLSAGDELQIVLHPQKNAHLYLFLLDSQKNLSLLFPTSISDYDNGLAWDEKYYLPSKNNRFYVDANVGVEKFYLLASHTRLTELEKLTSIFLSKPANKDFQSRVMAEIKKNQKHFSSIAGRGEKGVSIAGTVKTRSHSPIVEDSFFQVEASQFYGKIIRFKHE